MTPCGARACTGCRVCGCSALGIPPAVEIDHGRWIKDEQRYEDGCESGSPGHGWGDAP